MLRRCRLYWVRINASSVLASPVTSSRIEANRSQTAVASAVPLVVDSLRTDRKNTWKARTLNVMQELASVLLVFQQGQGERHGFNNGEGSKWRQHVHPVPCCPQPFFNALGLANTGSNVHPSHSGRYAKECTQHIARKPRTSHHDHHRREECQDEHCTVRRALHCTFFSVRR